MNKKILIVLIACFLLAPSTISSEFSIKNEEPTNSVTEYILYEKTVFITGSSRIVDVFETPNDCAKIYVTARVGYFFTGYSEMYIRSVYHSSKENHSILGTGLYISGRYFLPSINYFNVNKFVPGHQIIEIAGLGVGIVTYYVKGET